MPVNVRYIVADLAPAVTFYERLGFEVEMSPGPGFAMLRREGVRLLLNTPGGGGGAGQAMPDGAVPQPGGWNRFQLEVSNLDRLVSELSEAGVAFRSGVIGGRGGRQAIAEDPSGNPIEFFEPGATEVSARMPTDRRR